MPTITIPDRQTLSLGRNGAIGTLDVEWSRIPQHILDHIWAVYSVQHFTDAANSGGKDATMADRLALAQKKLEQDYKGELRARGEASEPVDPVENEAWKMAKAAMIEHYKALNAWDAPKGTKDRFAYVIAKRRAERGLPELPADEGVKDAIEKYLAAPSNAHIRKAAARMVKERQEAIGKVVNDDTLI